MKKIVFDIETKNTFEEVNSGDPTALDVSVVGIYDYENDAYHCFDETELDKLWPFFDSADMIIGFNSNHFDIPIMDKYYPGDMKKIKSLDILHEIKKSLGRRVSLNSVAEGSLGAKKSGHGLDAVIWYKRGEIDKIKKYCQDDVKITKDVYEFALVNGYLNSTYKGITKKIALDTNKWEIETPAMNNQTLF